MTSTFDPNKKTSEDVSTKPSDINPLGSNPLDNKVTVHDAASHSESRNEPHSGAYSEKGEESAFEYPSYTGTHKSKTSWLWMIPLLLVTLVVGLFGGQMWAKKQLADAKLSDEKSVDPQVSTASSVTEVNKAGSQKPVLTVETITPTQSKVEDDLTADGTISPESTSTVNGKVSGFAIDQVLVKEGDQVKKGQVLAVFDTAAMRQQQIQAQAELAEAESNYNLAKRDADRILPLLKIDAISQQEADRYVANANQAAASVAASKARLNNQNLNLNNAQVTAPVTGVISEKNADVGSVPGPEPLFTIIESGKLEWQAQVDPNKVGRINRGTPVEVSLPNNKSVKGQVTRISPTAEDGSRQITIYASLAPHPNARAGMYQRGTFKLGSEQKVTIPVSAVVTQDGYDYVMQVKAVKDANRNTVYRVSQVKVKLGERQGDRVVLLEPLSGEGNIVRQGGSFLSDGDIVRIAETTPKPAT